jgi:hypothetical protein
LKPAILYCGAAVPFLALIRLYNGIRFGFEDTAGSNMEVERLLQSLRLSLHKT